MTAVVLNWRIPDARLGAWTGPAGMLPAVTRNPSLPIAAIIGPPGPPGPGGGTTSTSLDFSNAANSGLLALILEDF